MGLPKISELPAIFKDVKQETHDQAMLKLQRMRKMYPTYRDDQLLMLEVCDLIETMKHMDYNS